jgi:hypothetical protein
MSLSKVDIEIKELASLRRLRPREELKLDQVVTTERSFSNRHARGHEFASSATAQYDIESE